MMMMKPSRFVILFLVMLIVLTACGEHADSQTLEILTASESGAFPAAGRVYTLEQTITFSNIGSGQPDKFNLWVALIRTFPPYQEVTDISIAPQRYTLVTDEYGNSYAEFELSEIAPGDTVTIAINYQVTVYPFAADVQACAGEMGEEFTQAELHIEANNPQIQSLAQQLTQKGDTVCRQVERFYDYARENLTYTPNQFSWGAQSTFGEMGADCTEFASLVIALSRAQGIPARYLEGILYLENQEANGGKIEHAWLEAYLPGIGWAPLDPTMGRSPLTRSEYLFKVPADRFIVTLGRNPSTLRGGSYFTYIYWPGNSTTIELVAQNWHIERLDP